MPTPRRMRGTRRSSSTWRRCRPTYRLSIGLPGGSQAFAIAERLGLPAAIVADARSRLTEGQQAFEETLAAIKAAEGETRARSSGHGRPRQRAAEALR